jgi:hypothetical protein
MEFTYDVEVVALYLGLVTLVNRIVAGFFAPIIDKLKIDKFYLMYVSWVLGAFIVYTTGFNLFVDLIPNPLIGEIFTAVVVGGGANILHDVTGS